MPGDDVGHPHYGDDNLGAGRGKPGLSSRTGRPSGRDNPVFQGADLLAGTQNHAAQTDAQGLTLSFHPQRIQPQHFVIQFTAHFTQAFFM